jgi:hypothetical protein
MHYARLRSHGTPGPAEPIKAANGTGYTHPSGYRTITVQGVSVSEHRHIMEGMLGRRLLPGEEVHHRNAVRSDNRPSNLQLWTTSHPAGSTVADKVAWAREILALYEAVPPSVL